MRTTLNVPDDLAIKAKQRALNEHTTMTALIVEGLAERIGRHAEQRELPVCEASGGLCDGVDWMSLEERASVQDWHR